MGDEKRKAVEERPTKRRKGKNECPRCLKRKPAVAWTKLGYHATVEREDEQKLTNK
jgi:hypothetical protein